MKDEDARIETVNIWTDVLGVILPGIGLAGSLVNSGIKASYFYLVFTYYAPFSITAVQQIPNIVDSGDKAEEVKEAINKNAIVAMLKKDLKALTYNIGLSVKEDEFGVIILKKNDEEKYVISFKNSSLKGKVKKSIDLDSFNHEISMVDILYRYILPNLKIKDKSISDASDITITGFNIGAEIAEVFSFYSYLFDKKYKCKVFKTTNNSAYQKMKYISEYELANLYSINTEPFLYKLSKSIESSSEMGSLSLATLASFIPSVSTLLTWIMIFLPKILSYVYNEIKKNYINRIIKILLDNKILTKISTNDGITYYSITKNIYNNFQKGITKMHFDTGGTGTYSYALRLLASSTSKEISVNLSEVISYYIDNCFFGVSSDFISVGNEEYESKITSTSHYEENPIKKANESGYNVVVIEGIKTFFYSKYILKKEQSGIYSLKKEQKIGKYITTRSESSEPLKIDGVELPNIKYGKSSYVESDFVPMINTSFILEERLKKVYEFNQTLNKNGLMKDYVLYSYEYKYEAEDKKDNEEKNKKNIEQFKKGSSYIYRQSDMHIHMYKLPVSFITKSIPINTEFIFWPYIGNQGAIELRNFISSENTINLNYAISLFKSVVEEYNHTFIPEKEHNFYTAIEKGEDSIKFYEKYLSNPGSKNISPGTKKDAFDTLLYMFDQYIKNLANYNFESQTKGEKILSFYFLNEAFNYVLGNESKILGFFKRREDVTSDMHNNIIFGFSKSDYTYNEKPIQYVYNPKDHIYRNLLILNYKKGDDKEIEKKEANKTPITSGIKLICTNSAGTTSEFIATNATGATKDGKTYGVETDRSVGENIKSFGKCKIANNGTCSPVISGQWTNTGNTKITIDNQKMITTESTIMCARADGVTGTISIVEDQNTNAQTADNGMKLSGDY
jgi:hypothetical protein